MSSSDGKAKGGALPKAVLVGVQLPAVSDEEHESSLAELGRLVKTMGFEVVATISQKRRSSAPGTVLGEGKLRELAALTGGTGEVESLVQRKVTKAAERMAEADEDDDDLIEEDDDDFFEEADDSAGPPPKAIATKVVFDQELSPSELRSLESATGAEVLDRTGVIVEIFHRHAKTREARLQVEIARLRYLAPRLRATGGGDRQGGGIGAKGVGETSHELDRRRIRDRIAELERELTLAHKNAAGRRARRQDSHRVALVGYTNAGKSSLMRALTGSEVLVEDKLFATLDTTVRAMQPEDYLGILVSDTVGFIKKLPHDLVASFRSTLDEAAEASILLFVVDASDPTFRSHLETTQTVLAEIAGDIPRMIVLNKADQITPSEQTRLLAEFPGAVMISTRSSDDIARLKERLRDFFERDMTATKVFVPYAKTAILGKVRKTTRVVKETFEDEGVSLELKGPPHAIEAILDAIRP